MPVSKRKEEYKHAYEFYKSLPNSLREKSIIKVEALLKDQKLVRDLKYFPIDKYLKKIALNGYENHCLK